jgi:hypothetical protein
MTTGAKSVHNELLLKNMVEDSATAIIDGMKYDIIKNDHDMAVSGMDMKTIKFRITESDSYFIADALDYPIVTQAKTWNKLMRMIDDVVRLYFKLDSDEKYHLELDISSQVLSTVK